VASSELTWPGWRAIRQNWTSTPRCPRYGWEADWNADSRTPYSGVLSAAVPATTVTAFGQLDLAAPGGPAFVALIGAAFPLPGLQLGLGFSLSGVGGVVGINKAVNQDALIAAIADGTAAELLFPPDPVAAARRVVPRLPALFPTAPGRAVVGPMFQVSWGGRMVSLSAAVVAELPDPVRLSLLGVLRVAVPDPAVPLIHLKATFAGQYDSAEPSALLMASLNGSHMAGVPMEGDVLLVSRGATLCSAGGFHPAYPVPRGVPALHRLAMNLSPVPWIQLRCQAYFAITSNTLQFGARLSLVAEVADCGLRGQFGLDVLIRREPNLSFTADMRGSVSVEVFGETLLGIAFALTLEGPAPWHAVGRGSIDLFLFSASFAFDLRWGNPPPALPAEPADLRGRLEKAFARPEAWSAMPPGKGEYLPVLLSPAANRKIGDGSLVHPHGPSSPGSVSCPSESTSSATARRCSTPQRPGTSAPPHSVERTPTTDRPSTSSPPVSSADSATTSS
jgi:hypothetical protein